MKSPQTIKRLTATVFAYATEDEELVAATLLSLLPEEFTEAEIDIYREGLIGQYDEPLIKLELEVTKKRELHKVLAHLGEQFSHAERKYITRRLENMIDKDSNTFHLRFDKMKAAEGILKLGEGSNTVKVVIKFVRYTKDLTPFINELRRYKIIHSIKEES